ncbi:MAG: PIG-L deacetylase family protein [archaeon]
MRSSLEIMFNRILQFPTTLVGVFAHEDDEVIGAGGTLCKNARLGGKSHVVCFGGVDKKRVDELERACKTLGISYELLGHNQEHYTEIPYGETVNVVRDIIIQHKPEFVITHRADGDYHRDHGVVSSIAMDACQKAQNPSNLCRIKGLLYTETHSLHSVMHVLVDISEDYEKALEALGEHESQVDKLVGYYTQLYDKRTALRGLQAGCERAEAFVFDPLPIIGSLNRHRLGV